MPRNKHPDKEIEDALQQAESDGWSVKTCSGHAWGTLRCPNNDKACRCGVFCQMSVWSTPKSPGNHARQLIQKVKSCIYEKSSSPDEGSTDEDSPT